MSASTLSGQLVTGDQLRPGRLEFASTIQAVIPAGDAPEGLLILPGFIDTHVHGGDGADTMDGADAVRRLARFHARHGTTTLYPTTVTNPWPGVLQALQAVHEVRARGPLAGGPDIPGAHLEGPFISPQRLGAQPPDTLLPTPELIRQVLALDVVRAVTIAPELPGALEAALSLGRAGVRIGVGHTRADAETVSAFLAALREAGVRTCATHLFNAMGGIEGREPGVPGALLADPHAFLEVILDGLHVHPTSFRLARAAAPERVLLITDAMRAAGQAEGESELGGQRVLVRGGAARLENGSLAGSLLTLDGALRRAVQAGIPLPEASRMLSAVPARSMGLSDRGELAVGQRADVVVLDRALNVQAVYVGGQPVWSLLA
ncbi:N-acetylglucosamine-6-phosphate deacetylase [Deinococcus koreensis]|uniref:N-acetylglucosamine-6-phosphate deacetylase n=1 Tax=Deinococcus koreensis TaxID=2054903 RepID=A0A2K3UVC7_9DEIO|nr:N-acetylglucosamine-6-phosphate deacetylase [Deinococcus koreensis]PNY80470.1 N-acetylglucosamine-6-phosphate deacetylase [Deinococcus koreensis]